MGKRNPDDRDAADGADRKFRRAINMVEHHYSDRWPARGAANYRDGEYRPLDDVSRQGSLTRYLKRPSESR
jgi:hypothetical protein